jgi:excisionase family DNA binding protein
MGGDRQRAYLRPAEVASLLCVSPKTVARWCREGKLSAEVTFGGHRRFNRAEIERIVGEMNRGQ